MPTRNDLFKKMSLRRFFVLIICTGVVVCSAVYTLAQTWRDFDREKDSYTTFQRKISEMMVNSLREPLVQGASIEASLRVQSFLKQEPSVICLTIEGQDIPGANCQGKSLTSKSIFQTHDELFFDSEKTQSFAKVNIFYDNSGLYGAWKRKLRDSLIINLLISLLVFSLIGTLAARLLRNDIKTVLDECNPETQGKQTSEGIRIKEFSHLFHELQGYIAEAKLNAEARAAAEIAKQVAHDIRSPLAALRMTIESLDSLKADTRRTIQSAFERINDIANDLMSRWPAISRSRVTEDSEQKVELLNDLIESIVSEKRIQYRELSGIGLELKTGRKAHALFASISGHRLKRALSNIIDNSYEAMSQQGKIVVSISLEGAKAQIAVQDTGKGIPAEILPKLMQRGNTFGKDKGSGLGLYDARKTVEGWGGSVSLDSQIGQGTTVRISLPLVKEPDWFARKITLDSRTTVVSIDDDISIHDIWRSRFSSVVDNFDGIRFITFSSITEFIDWHSKEGGSNCLFLVDYEFLRQSMTGLDLVEHLHIEQQSILVTSRYTESAVSERARSLGVSILPKNLAGFVPFEITA